MGKIIEFPSERETNSREETISCLLIQLRATFPEWNPVRLRELIKEVGTEEVLKILKDLNEEDSFLELSQEEEDFHRYAGVERDDRDNNPAGTESLRRLLDSLERLRGNTEVSFFEEGRLIGVEVPFFNEMVYADFFTRQGSGPDFFQLLIGEPGLAGFGRIMGAKNGEEYRDAMLEQDCICVSYENKESLSPENYEAVKKTGLYSKEDGQERWPMMFRKQGRFSEALPNEQECAVFIYAADIINKHLKEIVDRLEKENGQTPIITERGVEIGKIEIPVYIYEDVVIEDREILRDVKTCIINRQKKLEIDLVDGVRPVEFSEGGRRVLPTYLISAECGAREPFDVCQLKTTDTHVNAVIESVYGFCLDFGRPSIIYVKSNYVYKILKDFCIKCRILLQKKDSLPAVEKISQQYL